MIRKNMTVEEAAREWVDEFNAVPAGVLEKLREFGDSVKEITPLKRGDRVSVVDGIYAGEDGEVVRVPENGDNCYVICLDSSDEKVKGSSKDLTAEEGGNLPMWRTMWTFSDPCDKRWAEDPQHLRMMASCGFRLYKQADYGLIFGIDGAGDDFFQSFWIPLYRARELHWHNPDTETKEVS